MKAQGYSHTQTGIKSTDNEDSCLVAGDIGLFIVCDGVGGHLAGGTASKTAVATVEKYIRQHLSRLTEKVSNSERPAVKVVTDAIQAACHAVYEEGERNPDCHGMGCTLTMALVVGNIAIIGHVGDSRIYLVRKGVASQLSRDHTVVQELVDQGVISPLAAKNSPYAHVLSRAIGPVESVVADILQLELLHEDRLILCSDGVCDVLEDERFALIGADKKPEISPKKLVDAAFKCGSADDLTAVVVSLTSLQPESESERARSERVELTMDILQRMYLFEELGVDELVRVVERCTIENCKGGDLLIRKGSPGDSLYVILKGTFEVSAGGKILTVLGDGSHVGEMALLSGEPRSADVRAASDGELLCLRREDFQSLLAQEPKMGVKLLTSLSKELSARLRAMNVASAG